MTDYRSLSGAEFQREVGTDPARWAEAFAQRAAAMSELISDGLRDELAEWFADAMEAARKGSIREVIKEDLFGPTARKNSIRNVIEGDKT